MKPCRWATGGVLGAVGWAALGCGVAQAGMVILPTDPATKLNVSSSVTVSLYQPDSALPSSAGLQAPSRCTTTGTPLFRDVTDCWLPELGKPVWVVINGSAIVPMLVPHAPATFPLAPTAQNPYVAALTTSAYPGQCTNVGSDPNDDFMLSPNAETLVTSTGSVTGYKLTPLDCGGMAVIQVGTASTAPRFIVPRDGTLTVPANGIPDAWEALYGGTVNPAPDADFGPIATSLCCDGIANFDEYRGFIVSGKQIRTDPTQRDLFLRLMNPVCPVPGIETPPSLLGGGTTTYPTPTNLTTTLRLPATAGTVGSTGTFTANAAVFSNAHTLGEIIGLSGTNVVGRATIIAVANSTSASAQITQAFSTTPTSWQIRESVFGTIFSLLPPNQVHVLGYTPGDTNSTSAEWIDTFVSLTPSTSGPAALSVSNSNSDRTINPNRVYGVAQKGLRLMECQDSASPASLLGWAYGVGSPNAVGNVVLYTQTIINQMTGMAASNSLQYSTASLVNGAWTWSSPVQVNLGFIISRAIQYYAAMEVVHSLNLTPGIQGTNKTSYGHHWAPGTGDCVDQTITSTTKGNTVTFYIPSLCGTADQGTFVLQ
jgi:hypothetical protein